MDVILHKARGERFLQPTTQELINLGLYEHISAKNIIEPTNDEVLNFSGVDLGYGIPLKVVDNNGTRPSEIYAPTEDDFVKLGIGLSCNGFPRKRSYDVRDEVAYVDLSDGELEKIISIADSQLAQKIGASWWKIDFSEKYPISSFYWDNTNALPKMADLCETGV